MTKIISVRMTEELVKLIDALSKKEDRSRSKIITRVLTAHLQEQGESE